MPLRTTSDLVIGIRPLVKSDDDLTPFITAASSLVDNVCVKTPAVYADSQLELIERWLSAHFYQTLRRQFKFRSAGKVQESVESTVDLGLSNSEYGQMAMVLDYRGYLAALNNSLKVVKTFLDGGTYIIQVKYLGDTCL